MTLAREKPPGDVAPVYRCSVRQFTNYERAATLRAIVGLVTSDDSQHTGDPDGKPAAGRVRRC